MALTVADQRLGGRGGAGGGGGHWRRRLVARALSPPRGPVGGPLQTARAARRRPRRRPAAARQWGGRARSAKEGRPAPGDRPRGAAGQRLIWAAAPWRGRGAGAADRAGGIPPHQWPRRRAPARPRPRPARPTASTTTFVRRAGAGAPAAGAWPRCAALSMCEDPPASARGAHRLFSRTASSAELEARAMALKREEGGVVVEWVGGRCALGKGGAQRPASLCPPTRNRRPRVALQWTTALATRPTPPPLITAAPATLSAPPPPPGRATPRPAGGSGRTRPARPTRRSRRGGGAAGPSRRRRPRCCARGRRVSTTTGSACPARPPTAAGPANRGRAVVWAGARGARGRAAAGTAGERVGRARGAFPPPPPPSRDGSRARKAPRHSEDIESASRGAPRPPGRLRRGGVGRSGERGRRRQQLTR